jgi:hypothetical protein
MAKAGMLAIAAASGVLRTSMMAPIQCGLLLFDASINRRMRGRNPRLIKSRPPSHFGTRRVRFGRGAMCARHLRSEKSDRIERLPARGDEVTLYDDRHAASAARTASGH